MSYATGRGYRLARYEDLNARLGQNETDQLRPWVKGFVRSVGEKEAKRLLKNVGVLESMPRDTLSTTDQELDSSSVEHVYKVGDIVQANYKGDGYWMWAEVSAVLSNGFYNVFYAEDCSEEIATYGARMRQSGKAYPSSLNDTDFEMLMMES